ncbi:AI-2E family transporter [Bacillus kwashiorkori]|uniref:AI-2E family transporter n=1 Tax=Bacillus kwashiorkori TaxID=1522318 RepID=UPI000784E23F|nr:AI-2E family transporter [Bacillus kwashiorkori]
MKKSKSQFWLIQILLIVAIIYISTKISFLFEPVFIFVSTLFFPILISGFLFFLFNPVVTLAEKYKVPRTLGILLIYLIFIGLIAIVSAIGGPILVRQIGDLFDNIPLYIRETQKMISEMGDSKIFQWVQTQDYVKLEDIEQSLTGFLAGLPKMVTSSLTSIVSVVTNITLTIVTVPFLLFFMLKDGHKLPKSIVKFLPRSYRDEGLVILKDMNKTLAAYIQGQMTICLLVGTISFIGFLIIGLPYPLILALIIAVTNIIPYVGPFLGATPAVLVGLFDSWMLAVLAIVVIVVAQQIDSNLLSPLIIGKQLDTHPATIIILLLVAGNLAGILGMILAVPVYAVTKTFVLNIVRFVRLHQSHKHGKEQVNIT